MTTAGNTQEFKTMIFIDAGVENYQTLVDGVEEGVEVHVLGEDSDGIDKITTTLNTAAETGVIDAVHIVSDGSPGYIQLGNGSLSVKTLESYESQLDQWRQALSPEACILVYASQVAGSEVGKELVDSLGEITGASIAASEDDTGNGAAGGNWELEYTTGTIAGDLALTPEVRGAYGDLLSAVITVTSANESGPGSLREAIAQARDGETIEFDSSLENRTIVLSSGQLEILDKDLIVDGRDAPGLKISGNENTRLIDVQATNWSGKPIDLTLRNLTLADGRVNGRGWDGAGGGIRTVNGTKLTIENATFENNYANGEGGGAIFAGFRTTNIIIDSVFESNSSSGNAEVGIGERGGGAIAVGSESNTTVTGSTFNNNSGINGGGINTVLGGLRVENSTFSNNDSTPGGAFGPHTRGYGGAIYTDGGSETTDTSTSGMIEIINSRFEGNKAAGQGGGLFLFAYPGDEVTVENSTIINNQVVEDTQGAALGGGVRHGGGGKLEIKNTTFANNTARLQGGGLWVGEESEVTIENSTFSGNSAGLEDNSGVGGAIALRNDNATTNIINTTIAYNRAGLEAGGFWKGSSGGDNTTITNTIVAYNEGVKFNHKHQTDTQFRDGGGNIQSNELRPDDTLIAAGVTIADPLLGELQEINGVLVHPLIPGSPAIDGGVNGGAPETDQVETVRPIDGDGNGTARVDSGAYEFSGDSEPPQDGLTLDIDEDGQINPFTDGRLIIFYLFFGNLEVISDDVIGGAIGTGANRNTVDAITNYLDSARDSMLDVDGNGDANAQTDGILIMRYMFENTGESLISGALAPDATRITPEAVIEFLQQFDPRVIDMQAEQQSSLNASSLGLG